jgi:hypothetical protein
VSLLHYAIFNRDFTVSKFFIDYGVRVEWCIPTSGHSNEFFMELIIYQRGRDELLLLKKKRCQAAGVILLSKKLRHVMPRDVSKYLCRRYLWPLREDDAWLHEESEEKHLKKDE